MHSAVSNAYYSSVFDKVVPQTKQLKDLYRVLMSSTRKVSGLHAKTVHGFCVNFFDFPCNHATCNKQCIN